MYVTQERGTFPLGILRFVRIPNEDFPHSSVSNKLKGGMDETVTILQTFFERMCCIFGLSSMVALRSSQYQYHMGGVQYTPGSVSTSALCTF